MDLKRETNFKSEKFYYIVCRSLNSTLTHRKLVINSERKTFQLDANFRRKDDSAVLEVTHGKKREQTKRFFANVLFTFI